MATFVFVHGGGGSAWDFHLLLPELTNRGHAALAPNLPIENETSGFTEHRDAVVHAIGELRDLVLVGHSYGGFTVPLVADALADRTSALVFLSGMIPAPGEPPADWWSNTGFEEAPGLSEDEMFYGGVPAELVAQAPEHSRRQASREYHEPWPLATLPDVPTSVVIPRDDRFFTAAFQRRLAEKRLGTAEIHEIPGGHAVTLSHPVELADTLIALSAAPRS